MNLFFFLYHTLNNIQFQRCAEVMMQQIKGINVLFSQDRTNVEALDNVSEMIHQLYSFNAFRCR